MIFSRNIREAIKLALKTHELHQKQKRKGKDVPYIVHPLIVGMLLARVGAPEEVIAAGIIHDTIEDSHPATPVTRKKIEHLLGPSIATLVASVTEDDSIVEWQERKNDLIARIAAYPYHSVLVKSADVLANCTELIHDIEDDGIVVFNRFGGSALRVLEHYCNAIQALEKRSQTFPRRQKNPFLGELKKVRRVLLRYHKQYSAGKTK